MDKRKTVASIFVATAVFIGALFGFEGVKLESYKDPVGIPTIGAGHTGPEVKLGQKITRKQAEELAVKDAKKHWDGIRKYIKVPVYQHEAEAYTSFAYNLGVGTFANSSILTYLNMKQYETACSRIKLYRCAGFKTIIVKGKKKKVCNELPGLVKRRNAEYKRCMGGEWQQAANDAQYLMVA